MWRHSSGIDVPEKERVVAMRVPEFLRNAVQAFAAVIVIGQSSTIRTALIAAAAALLSAVKTLAKERMAS